MNITIEEERMYEVMRALYDSGIPISFKGSMVLKACLLEAGYVGDVRHTFDIDANWFSDMPPTAGQMTDSLQKALKKAGISLRVSLYRMYGPGRSAGFELTDPASGEILFTMDIDVNRPVPTSKIYEAAGLKFRGVSPCQMIADKVFVLSTDKVFRRIKDVLDLYYLSAVFPFDTDAVLQILETCGRTLDTFHGFLYKYEDLKHSYEKFRFTGDIYKPSFEDVYETVKTYIKDVLPVSGLSVYNV